MLSTDAFEILDLVTEDSYGLWEIATRFRGRYRDRTATQALALAQATAIELLGESLVSLWSQADIDGEEVAVPGEEARAALSDSANWNWPSGSSGSMLRMLATDAGQRAYHSS